MVSIKWPGRCDARVSGFASLLGLNLLLAISGPGYARARTEDTARAESVLHPAGVAHQKIDYQLRRQEVGKLNVTWSNVGRNAGIINELYRPDCDQEVTSSAIEYPKGSNHLWDGFQLWLGGVRGGDTLVSTMEDVLIWSGDSGHYVREVYPAPPPEGDLVERTSRERLSRGPLCPDLKQSDEAISEHDMLSISTDTITDLGLTDYNPFDQRRHEPLGLRLTCRRYAWSYDYADDFVLVDYKLENLGIRGGGSSDSPRRITDLVIGVLVRNGVTTFGGGLPSYRDITGILGRVPTAPLLNRPEFQEKFNLLWAANEDGNPLNGAFDAQSVTEVFGLRVLRPGLSESRFSFNWWTNPEVVTGWGPRLLGSQVEFESQGNFGKPETDRGKYQLMTNGEVDYPQVEAAIVHPGWYPPPADGSYIASGHGFVNGLLSFGPYQLDVGDSITFAIALVGGEHFHTNPMHFASTFDPFRPDEYMAGLDFSDLIQNARWAGWLYDSPGFDTDGDGYKGEYYVDGLDTLYYQGDGVPDFSGPPPPPAPGLSVTTSQGEIYVRWNGYRSETTLDPFFNRRDFEGYRVYVSRTGNPGDWSLAAQRDLFNYARHTWNESRQRWLMQDPPFSRDSLKSMYDTLCLVQYGYPFEPDSFAVASQEEAFLEIQFDPKYPDRLDSLYRYFGPYEANAVADDKALEMAVAGGLPVFNVIRKVYPDSSDTAVATRPDGTLFAPFYEYEFALKDLQLAEPIVVAVTAFDHGDPQSNFPPLETTPETNAKSVWPVNSAEVVKSGRPKPGVYPNPYRLIDDYYGNNWENRRGLEPDRERARQVTFYNVPDTCVLSIYTLDGDLVKRLHHSYPPESSEATVVRWDLITRNTQAVKTGIYIWSVESRFGTDVGKLVIIK